MNTSENGDDVVIVSETHMVTNFDVFAALTTIITAAIGGVERREFRNIILHFNPFGDVVQVEANYYTYPTPPPTPPSPSYTPPPPYTP